jgi:hypothetical protein
MSTTELKRVLDRDTVAMELLYTVLVFYEDLEKCSAVMGSMGYEISAAKCGVYRDGQVPLHSVFLERRKELTPAREAILKDGLLAEAEQATAVVGLCLASVKRQIDEGKELDFAKTARDLSQLRSQGIEKRALLEGKPTHIVEKRSPDELVRALESLGVAQRVALEVPDAEVVEE